MLPPDSLVWGKVSLLIINTKDVCTFSLYFSYINTINNATFGGVWPNHNVIY